MLALSGHVMLARWHLGPITGFHFWLVLITSPEVLVFLFFMITDPKTAPRSPTHRLVYAVSLGVLASLMIAAATTEFASKVALLSSLAVVCLAMPVLRRWPIPVDRRLALVAVPAVLVAFAGVIALSNTKTTTSFRALPVGALPPITIEASQGVQTELDLHTAQLIAHDLLSTVHATTADRLTMHLAPGRGQNPPVAIAQLAGQAYQLNQQATGHWALAVAPPAQVAAGGVESSALAGLRLTNLAPSLGLDFQQGAFRYGMSSDTKAMMGGGVCWLDYNNDGWQDLFAVNSYASADAPQWEAHGGLPRTTLFENVDGTFKDVSADTHADLPVQGDGCAAADLNGDGHTDLVVTTTSGVDVLWNTGHGTFTHAQLPGNGWYTGAAVADVNGDGRPDLFVAGYSDLNQPVPNSLAGFPTNVAGVRDLLYLNEGAGRFKEVGAQAGLEAANFHHGLGATFTDVNGDGRPDIYVANDEDPNQLYVNVPWPGGASADPTGLGFRFEERAATAGVADPYAGMGVATSVTSGGRLGLFVTNSRNEPSAAYVQTATGAFANVRPRFVPALGTGFAGWGATWVDFANSGTPDLLLAAGAIPVTNLSADAEAVRVLAPVGGATTFGDAKGVVAAKGMQLNGRGAAAADVANDGRMDVAINTIGGKLVLLHPSGPSGNWLDVQLSRFAPGAVVTVALPNGKRLTRMVQAGSSYLSSEDQRVHFGLGAATSVRSLTVRYPWGGASFRGNVAANRVVRIASPPPVTVGRQTSLDVRAGELHARTAARPVGRADLERRRGRHASAGRCIGARPGPRSLRSLDDDLPSLAGDGRTARPRDCDQLRRLPATRLARVVRGEPRTDIRAPQRAPARALPLTRFHTCLRRLSSGAREPHRRSSDRRRPPRRLERGAALRRPELHAGERAVARRCFRLDRSRPDVLAAAGPLAKGRPGRRLGPGGRPDVRGFAVGPRAHLCGRRRCRPAASRRPVERRLQAGRRRSDPGHVAGGCPDRGGRVADRLEPGRCAAPRGDRRRGAPRARRSARSRPERRAQRRGRLRLGREACVPVAAADLDDPVPRVQQPAPTRPGPRQARRRAPARSPRRPLGTGCTLEPARPDAGVARSDLR